jgi:NADPH:quinone reductase-like Zn-dependent oxidoreductase/acyl carrier protein
MAGCFASEREDTPWVPVQVGALRLLQRPVGELYCHVQALAADAASPGKRRAELCVADGTGAVVAEIGGLVVQRLAGAGRSEQDDWYLAVHWEAAAVASAKLSAGRWLLLGRGQGFAESLRAALGQAGHAVAQAAAVPRHREAVRELLSSAFPGSVPTAIVHLESLEEEAAPAGDELPLSVQRLSESVLHTVQALVGQGYREVPRLWLLTRGAQAVDVEAVAVAQAPLLGLGRTLALEHPELRCARLDLDPGRPGDECAAVLAELLADTAEEEIALRSRRRLVSRLVRRAPQRGPREQWEPAKGRSLRLELDAAGVLDQLVLRATARRPPGPGEVELAVEAAGLNFRDVLLALGAIPSEQGSGGAAALQLGSECAGRILAVGPGVQGLAAGDAVMAVAPGCFASHLTCPAALVLPTPAGMSSEQAAAIPVAFLTAYYALSKLAQLGSAERLLIHAATGGVGLAAIQWAQHVGAQVYATAGSPEKRAYLESLGVRHHSDSRSDQFVEDVRGWTAGEGVDVILNSLSGELIPKSLELLRDQGRFIELGKRDYYENAQLGMRPFLRNLTFSLLDLSGLLRRQPARMRQVLQEILQLFAAGVFRLPPLVRVGLDRAADAFRTMAQAQHLGKIVLTAAAADARIRVPVGDKVTIRQDSSYLISGGLGGLGLSVASWLAEQGAGQLVLLSRRGIQSAAQEAAVAALRARGSRVRVAQADVADRAAVAALLRELSDSGQALRGVVHAAGVVDDAVLLQQRPEKFAHVLRPKVQGGWNLHELTRELPLDFFVMYSSAAGLLGSPGQANYAAANTFLDALAHHRRFEGLPGLSIDWGVFGEVGLAAADSGRAARLALRGMRSLLPAQGLQALRELLGTGEAQVAVAPLNLRQWGAFYQVAAASPRLSALRSEAGGSAAAGRDHELLARLGAAPAAARAALIAEYLRAQVAQVLRTPEAELDVSAPLTSLGLDSLMGLELRNHIESALGLRLSATLLWTYPTLAALCQHISVELFPAAEVAAPPSSEVDLATGSELETAPLDDSQLLTLLDDELALARKSGA